MAGSSQSGIKIMTVDLNDVLRVMHYDKGTLIQKDKYAYIENVYYPYNFFAGIQQCDEEQYKAITGDLR